jgi:hypothetical protein
VQDGKAGATGGDAATVLTASDPDGSSDRGATAAPVEALGAGTSDEASPQPRLAHSSVDGALLGNDSSLSLLTGAVFALMGLGLLVGIGGGLRTLRYGRHSPFP